jgi:hypothetical protein
MNMRLNFNTTSNVYFGNQSQRGKLVKSIIDTERTLLEDIPDKLKNKVRRKEGELDKIQKTRWQAGNKRYQGKDKNIDGDSYN